MARCETDKETTRPRQLGHLLWMFELFSLLIHWRSLSSNLLTESFPHISAPIWHYSVASHYSMYAWERWIIMPLWVDSSSQVYIFPSPQSTSQMTQPLQILLRLPTKLPHQLTHLLELPYRRITHTLVQKTLRARHNHTFTPQPR